MERLKVKQSFQLEALSNLVHLELVAVKQGALDPYSLDLMVVEECGAVAYSSVPVVLEDTTVVMMVVGDVILKVEIHNLNMEEHVYMSLEHLAQLEL